MTLEEIKAAVEAGKTVHSDNDGYVIIKDSIGQWLICYNRGHLSEHCIGLTWQDGKTMNCDPDRCYIAGEKRPPPFSLDEELDRYQEFRDWWDGLDVATQQNWLRRKPNDRNRAIAMANLKAGVYPE